MKFSVTEFKNESEIRVPGRVWIEHKHGKIKSLGHGSEIFEVSESDTGKFNNFDYSTTKYGLSERQKICYVNVKS